MSDTEDPYAVSDSDEEVPKGPPPKIQIEGRSGDIAQMKTALAQQKAAERDTERAQEIEALKQKHEAKNIKKDFETGKVSTKTDEEVEAERAAREAEKKQVAEASKENYSKFKDRFEHLDNTLEENLEERLKSLEREKLGLGKEVLASAKERFEKGLDDDEGKIEREKVEIIRSEADKKRVLSAFQRDMTADEAPKECAVCSKIVYPVERVFANKVLYHRECFCCSRCQKKLLPTNYNSHEGRLLCKVHMLEVFHPEAAKDLDPANMEEDEHEVVEDSDDDEFAVSNKPRRVNKNVVRAGDSHISDELAQIRSLKEKKGEFESSVKQAEMIDKKTTIEEEIAAGKVKANLDKFVSGAADEEKKIQREELHFEQVGDIKNKWKTGQVETAEQKAARETEELEALRGGISVKERFKEGHMADAGVEKAWDASQLDTSLAAEARKSFLEGKAYETSAPTRSQPIEELDFSGKAKGFKEKFEKGEGDITEVQKTQVEIDGISLGDIKSAFEAKGRSTANMTPEERADQKQKEIEAEFLRYKLARKAAAKRAAEQGENASEPMVLGGLDTASGAGVGNIRDTFDSGKAFQGGEGGKEGVDVEIKVAGKARAKFQQLDTNAQPVLPKSQTSREPSKWDKKEVTATGEVVNRRADAGGLDDDSEEEEFDVKNLMNKFKKIGAADEGTKVLNTEQRAELERLHVGARNIKQQFEKGETGDDDEAEEQRRKERELEFERMKREREEMQQRLAEERAQEEAERVQEKEEIGVKAEHATKMAAKWEKIHAKEAKKAEKGRMPTKTSEQ